MSESECEKAVWIKTEPSLDGSTYVVTVEFSDDRAITLTPHSAPTYAMTILEAVARAEYDSAVYHQMLEMVSREEAVSLIRDIREDRPDIDYSATEPLNIEPGVNGAGEPFLHVRIDGELVGQWTMQGAREHALTALEVVAVADLDAGYYRALTGLIGADPEHARLVINDLSSHRQEAS